MQVTVPSNVAAGETIAVQSLTGQLLQVVVPQGLKAGDTFLASAGTGTAGAEQLGCASDAVAEYEKLLATASRIVFHRMPSKRPVVGAMALEVDGVRGALLIDVNIDNKEKSTMTPLRNMEPFGAFRTEMRLGDGRVVMNFEAHGTMDYIEFFAAQRAGTAEAQVMDREGPMSISHEYDKRYYSSMGCSALCNPLSALMRSRITHPQSVDDVLRPGHLLIASWRINGHRKCYDASILCCAASTCCSGPVCLACCIVPPVVHYELQELFHAGGSSAVEGVRYSQYSKTFCEEMGSRGLPDGDVITFTSTTPLHVRKDMIAMVAHRASVLVTTPDSA